MSTGIDLTDEFVFQFQELHRKCEEFESLRGVTGPGPNTSVEPSPPDPEVAERVVTLQQEIIRLEDELKSVEAALSVEAAARQASDLEVSTARGELRKAKAIFQKQKQQIAASMFEIKRLEKLLSESTPTESLEDSPLDFEETFPDEAEALEKYKSLVHLYEDRYGPII